MSIDIVSKAGKKAVVKYPKIATGFTLMDGQGNKVNATKVSDDEITFDTSKGETYRLTTTAPAGIDKTTAKRGGKGQRIVATHYYLPNGTRVAAPAKNGLYIASLQYENGKKETFKFVKYRSE